MEALPTAPITPQTQLSSRKWYEIWREVWLNPGVEAFWSILKDQNHSATRGFIWIGVTSLVLGLFTAVGYGPILRSTSTQSLSSLGTGESVLTGICGFILTPIITIIGMVILTGLFHLIAKLFNGNGKWSDLVFCMAAVWAPASLISSILGVIGSLLSGVRILFFLVAILFGIVFIVLAIYNIILYILAIRASENVGTGGAIATVLIPIGVVIVLGFCCTATLIPAFINTVR